MKYVLDERLFGEYFDTIIDLFFYTKELEITPIIFQCTAENTEILIKRVEDIGSAIAELVHISDAGGMYEQDYSRRMRRKRLIQKIKDLFERVCTTSNIRIQDSSIIKRYISFWSSMESYLRNQGWIIVEAYYKRKKALQQERKRREEMLRKNIISTEYITKKPKNISEYIASKKKDLKSLMQKHNFLSFSEPYTMQEPIFFKNGHINPNVRPLPPSDNWHVLYDLCLAQYYEILYELSLGRSEEIPLKKNKEENLIYTQYMSYYKNFLAKGSE